MAEFYHLGHFFEILTGIYFGGFALLGFIERGAHANILSKWRVRQSNARSRKILAKEYFIVNMANPFDRPFRFCGMFIFWVVYYLLQWLFDLPVIIANFELKRLSATEKEGLLEKKYFPSFFFTGCFCVTMILLSSVQFENVNNNICRLDIDYFMLYYLFSTVLFHVWSLVVLPYLVDKYEYLHLTFLSLIICGLLLTATIYLSLHPALIPSLEWFFLKQQRMKLIFFVIATVLFPLLFIFLSSVAIVFSWEIPIIFTSIALNYFGRNEVKKIFKVPAQS